MRCRIFKLHELLGTLMETISSIVTSNDVNCSTTTENDINQK
nr:MAG TPA: hypothetical protein [Caudoviricetes sp.]